MSLVRGTRLLCGQLSRSNWQCKASLSVSSVRRDNVVVTKDELGVATLSMNKGPVNSLNKEFLEELTSNLVAVRKDSSGLVLTSGLSSVFCAGLEITEMHQPDPVRLREFWRALQSLWVELYSYPLPTAAAITGHSPAGGCLMALCCDYRVMQGPKFTIGLNETLLGIVAPFWFKDSMLNTVGQRQTELALMLGTLFTADQALTVGLVDQGVQEREECLAEATKMVHRLVKIPSEARHVSKMLMRQPTLDRLTADRDADVEHFANFVTQPGIQKPLGRYLEALKSKSKKK